MTNLDSILKSRDITLSTKVCLVKAVIFPVVKYGCEIWTVKKSEHWRTDAFELWLWRRLLRVPWTARRSTQSILKELGPGCSLEGLMLKLKLQYFGHLMWRADSLEKTLMLGKIEGKRTRGRQRMRWLDGITNTMDIRLVGSGSWWWTGRPGVLRFMVSQRVRYDWASELNWYIYSLPVEPPYSLPSHSSRSSQSTRLGSCGMQHLPTSYFTPDSIYISMLLSYNSVLKPAVIFSYIERKTHKERKIMNVEWILLENSSSISKSGSSFLFI